MEICPAAISRIILGIKDGLNLGVPSPFAKFVTSSWNVIKPPIPLANTTPTRLVSTFSFEMPASATAWSLATSAVCVKRSTFLASLRSRKLVGSNPFISHAKRVLNFEASKRVIMSAPDTPFINPFQ